MEKYVKLSDVDKMLEDCFYRYDDPKYEQITKHYTEMPIADVESVKRGKWVKKKHLIPLAWDSSPFHWENYDEETHSEWKEYWHCSECDYEADRDMKPIFKYCPNCGARME